jgi:hypothetical protein
LDAGDASEIQPGHEFLSVEDMLRHDADQHPVPLTVAGRLRSSLAREPQTPNWWRRLLPGGK